MGCRFNIPIAKVRLVLKIVRAVATPRPSTWIHPLLRSRFRYLKMFHPSGREVPLPPGEYSRRISVVAEDGSEQAIDLDDIGGIVKLVDELPETDTPVQFPQHSDGRRTYTSALPDHIKAGYRCTGDAYT